MSLVDWLVWPWSADERRVAREITAEIRDELDFHLSMMIDENKRSGMSEADARWDAMRRFGDFDAIASDCHQLQFGPHSALRRFRLGLFAACAATALFAGFFFYRVQARQHATLTGLKSNLDALNEQLSTIVDRAPPVVVETSPRSGANGVDPSAEEIRVTFSKPMADQSWSWCQTEHPFPESVAPIHYLNDGKTCVMPVKLKPDTRYVLSINSPRYGNFKDSYGRSAEPYVLAFATAKSR